MNRNGSSNLCGVGGLTGSRIDALRLLTRPVVRLAEAEQRLRDIPVEKRQLADALRAGIIAERDRLAAFIIDNATAFAANPFPSTTAGAARQRGVSQTLNDRNNLLRTGCYDACPRPA
ncbi:hypothetical protein [Methylobacterium sp. yr596]|uniref:hypothetical protein n=1 Tax=Methylobacterium sp. yr596 TaxID=1761800 RepID=UPI0008E6B35F|nr:hypothetical protein [Methylobacterium sp. yr596]SFF72134.1 hypothetical protein SAMN04487844_14217 [Methylobacterium sp. yr596]